MTNRMIPTEAVAAAMSAAVRHYREASPNLAAAIDGQDELFRLALEAGMPHMQATRNELADILKRTGIPAGESYAGADAILERKGRTLS